MEISVVIATCNRKVSLLKLLENLNISEHALQEVIIVDSGEERLSQADFLKFTNLNVQYHACEKSVCIQRNKGIHLAKSPWIFICDDDIEMPANYLKKLVAHISIHSNAGAVSGLVLQKESGAWTSEYPVRSGMLLAWKFIFQLSIWGSIENNSNNFILKKIKKYYLKRGNHLSKAGWPVITNLSGAYWITPVYGLGASLIKKEWLLHSPFDEVLDRHGIGDNYGVAQGFPEKNIHIVNDAFVYHHHAAGNRLQKQLVYFRRALALDYFRQTNPTLGYIKKGWLLWSLAGNFFFFILLWDFFMLKPAIKTILKIAFEKNPYLSAALANKKVTEPVLQLSITTRLIKL